MNKVKIMIVDDAAFMRMVLKNILTENGHEIVGEVDNGLDAVALYEQIKPDLVTMDITMPDMNGVEATKAILAKDPDANIIMLSALSQEYMVRDAIAAGAKDYILKPFKKEKVIASIEKAIGK